MWWITVPLITLGIIYTVMVIGFWLGIYRTKRDVFPINKVPMPISIVVPIRNEEENINNLLTSFSNLDYPMELFEIILINDGSTDSGWCIAQEWADKLKNLVLLELSPNDTGKKKALALGVSQSLHNIVVFTDADCTHPVNWLSEISDNYKQNRWSMLIAPVMISPANSFFQKIQALEYASIIASSLGSCALGIPTIASSANIAFVKKPIGFNYQMLRPKKISGDDVFLLHSIKRLKGSKITYLHTPDSLVKTKPVNTFRSFLMQRARWASKAPSYRDGATVTIALIVLLLNALLVCASVCMLFIPGLWIVLLISYLVKIAVDLPILWSFLKKYDQRYLLKAYVPLQIIYPVYIVISFILALIMPINWKKSALLETKNEVNIV